MSSPETSHAQRPTEPGLPTIDVHEHGGKREGVRQSLDRRLFMQLLVVDAPPGQTGDSTAAMMGNLCAAAGIPAVLYADAMSPHGAGLLTWSESPEHFVGPVRGLFNDAAMKGAVVRPGFAMLGRTYGTGHEPDLEWSLLRRPIENVSAAAYRWHVWYPLRRTAAFARLDGHEQAQILREHAQIGMAYGAQGLATDVRLASYGLDAGDNEFVIGLVGKDLHPLSHLVQAMRKTRQTSEFIEKMGPFFVGHVVRRV
jgi:chlorite dismutase